MKSRKETALVVGILMAVMMLTGGVSLLYAHLAPHGGHGSWSPEEHAAWITDHLTKRLELNDAQRQELETIISELGEKRKALMELHLKGREQLLGLLREESMDSNGMRALADEHKQAIGDLITSVTDRLVDFTATLTPEQRARLADVIQERSAWFHGRFH